MQDNEFEKKLRQKLDALQVQPGEAVWENVRAQVGQKRRRRRFVFLLLLVLLAGGGWMFANRYGLFNTNAIAKMAEKNNGQQQAPEANDAPDLSANNPGEKETKVVAEGGKMAPSIKKEKTLQPALVNTFQTPDQINQPGASENDADKQSQAFSNRNRKTTKGRLKSTLTGPDIATEEIESDDVTEKGLTVPDTRNEPAEKQPGKIEAIPEQAAVEVHNGIVAGVQKDNIATPAKGSDKKNEVEKNHRNKWGVGFTFLYGRNLAASSSNIQQGLSFDNSGTYNPGTWNGQNGGFTPSEVRPGIALSAGITVFKTLSRQITITTGLQYQLLTSSIKVGNKMDSTFGGRNAVVFALAGSNQTQNYINRYHLLSLPVTLSATVFKIGGKDVFLETGISFSTLLHSNSLSFNPVTGKYYTDPDVFNKYFVGLSAAAGINIAGKNQRALTIGPAFDYSLTPLAGSNMYAKNHQRFWGIRLQKNLSK